MECNANAEERFVGIAQSRIVRWLGDSSIVRPPSRNGAMDRSNGNSGRPVDASHSLATLLSDLLLSRRHQYVARDKLVAQDTVRLRHSKPQ
jgi:hypothetical protein